MAALPCRSGRRTVATPHRSAAVLSDAAMAAALAGFSGRAEPYAGYPSLSSAGGGSVVLVGAQNGCGTLERMLCGFDPMSSLLGREIARERARSREMHVPVHCKTSCVVYSTWVSY